MNETVCSNCGAQGLKVLNGVDSRSSRVATSDGQFIDETSASRLLCQACSCIEVQFTPQDRLLNFFKTQYDISESVQNNLVVTDGKRSEKHKNIKENLFAHENQWAATGNYLEIACGAGELCLDFATSNKGWLCSGIDPSVKVKASEGSPNVTFIEDFFSEAHFSDKTFDIIVAHGILNRTPTLPLLKSIAKLCEPGALVSLELLSMEQSVFTPRIWDHSFAFLEKTFETYLAQCGFRIAKKYDCGSTWQYVCTYEADGKEYNAFDFSAETENYFFRQVRFWEELQSRGQKLISEHSKLGLFGAGLFSAIAMDLLGESHFDFVIDEVRKGTVMSKTPVMDLPDYSSGTVLLCARPRYMDFLEKKLKENNVLYVSLFSTKDLQDLELV